MRIPENIEKILSDATPSLNAAEKQVLWQRIDDALVTKPIPSPFLFSFIKTRPMIPTIALMFALTLGLGTTAAASQNARPGDLLFPVDRALEEVHLALTRSDEKRAEFQVALAEERLEELRSLLAEDDASDDNISTVVTANFEADVFTDITIVTVEINDRKSTFTTDADTRAEVVAEIARRYSVSESSIDAALDFEIEDRASRVNDIADTNRSNERISTSVTLLASLFEDIDNDTRSRFVNELHAALERRSDARIEVREDKDEDRIEIRSDDERIRVREKDGEVRIDVRGDDGQRLSGSFEAEADVFTDITIVTVEINDRKSTFTTDADTRAEVVAEIARRYSVSESSIDAALDFEIEDRASRTDDADNTSDDHDDDNSSDVDKIEVRVEGNVAEVRMEYGDKRLEFETLYTTRAALIVLLAARSGLSETVIQSNLNLEIRD